MTDEEKKRIAEATDKAIADTIEEMEESPDYIGFTGLEIEALILSARNGNKTAQKALDFLTQGAEGQETVKVSAEYLSVQEELSALITGIKQGQEVDPEALKSAIEKIKSFDNKPIFSIITRRPDTFISPKDKVSNKAFEGKLNGKGSLALKMERKGTNKPITTMVSIDFDEMQGITIRGRKELTIYDRAVHDAIITLYVEGGNDIITLPMIYRVMTGDPNARLKAKQAEAISNSVTKLMYSNITIDATDELKTYYGVDGLKYNGYLLVLERIIATVDSNVMEAIHVLRAPILYEYANYKNQIGRTDIKLLNTPGKKNEEIIALQSYLRLRILSFKGSKKLPPTIVYDTVYKQINVSAETPGALRKKKAKVRGQVKQILDYWKQEGFIKGYVENKHGQEVYSVSIRCDREGETYEEETED